jgi:hypothetical protein
VLVLSPAPTGGSANPGRNTTGGSINKPGRSFEFWNSKIRPTPVAPYTNKPRVIRQNQPQKHDGAKIIICSLSNLTTGEF